MSRKQTSETQRQILNPSLFIYTIHTSNLYILILGQVYWTSSVTLWHRLGLWWHIIDCLPGFSGSRCRCPPTHSSGELQGASHMRGRSVSMVLPLSPACISLPVSLQLQPLQWLHPKPSNCYCCGNESHKSFQLPGPSIDIELYNSELQRNFWEPSFLHFWSFATSTSFI